MTAEIGVGERIELRGRCIMSESHCRRVDPWGEHDLGRVSWSRGGSPPGRAHLRRRIAGGLLGGLVVLGWGLAQAGPSAGQEPPAGAEAPPQPAPAQPQESAEPLSTRYRFLEKYGLAADPAKPELITQYQVGALETIKTETEKAQGAPDRTEFTTQTIYTERPAKVGKLG